MREWRVLLRRLGGVFQSGRAAHLEEELREHAAQLAEEYRRQGMTEEEAHYAALREMGNLSLIQQDYHEQGGLPLMENFWLDLKYALRTLRRNSSFTMASVATLAIGLGAMITMLCVVSAVFWKPLPYPSAERLAALKQVDPRNSLWTFSGPAFLDVEERARTFSAVTAYERRTAALTGDGDAEVVEAAGVTPAFFRVFGIHLNAGRVLENAQPFVVISRGLAERKWGNDSSPIGRAILLDGLRYTIAGVAEMPIDLLPGVDLLLPLDLKATDSRSARELNAAGLLRPGVPLGEAQAELETIGTQLGREFGRTDAGWSMTAIPLANEIVGRRAAQTIWMIFAAVGLLWLLACANVAGLQAARSLSRAHEISTRVALGASKRRLLGQTMTESAVLAVAGALAGAAIAAGAVDAIRQMGNGLLPRVSQVHLDGATVGAAIGCMLITTVISGLFSVRTPSFQGGREVSRRDRGRDALIVGQVAMASVLLLCASLLAESFLRLRAADPGLDVERVLEVRVSLPSRLENERAKIAFFRDIAGQLERLPQVDKVGATNIAPFSGEGTVNRFRLERESGSNEYHSAAWRAVTPEFFRTLGIPLKRGRLFTTADRDGAPEVVVVSESMARQFWPNQDPVGQHLLWGSSGSVKTVIGVAGDIRDKAADERPLPMMYRPFAQLTQAPMTLVIKTRGAPLVAASDVRSAIWSVNPDVALVLQPMREAMAHSILGRTASLSAMAAFAILAMITAAFGLYGLISYRVNQRQQEIGIRLALGATPANVRWGVQQRCLRLAGTGAAIGLAAGYLTSGLMQSLLYETAPTEVSAYFAVALMFAVVALTASFGPAGRAARLDPAAAIRHE